MIAEALQAITATWLAAQCPDPEPSQARRPSSGDTDASPHNPTVGDGTTDSIRAALNTQDTTPDENINRNIDQSCGLILFKPGEQQLQPYVNTSTSPVAAVGEEHTRFDFDLDLWCMGGECGFDHTETGWDVPLIGERENI